LLCIVGQPENSNFKAFFGTAYLAPYDIAYVEKSVTQIQRQFDKGSFCVSGSATCVWQSSN